MAVAEIELNKNRAIKSLNDLLAASQQATDQAQALEERAQDEGRELTEEEEQEFLGLLQQAKDLKARHAEEIAADQRAARRQLLEETRREVSAAPSAMTAFNRGALRHVHYMYDRIMDDPGRGFASLGEFCMQVGQAFSPGTGQIDERLVKIGAAVSGMNQAQGSQGGYLVPPQFSQTIWDGMNAAPDNLMNFTDRYTVTGESLTFPANAETSRATGSRYGGVQGFWLAEGQQKAASFPRIRQVKLEPHELAVLIFATDKLLRNAPALDAYIRRAATEEIMFLVNNAILFGNGVGQPLGIMNSPALVTVAAEGGQAVDTVVRENIVKMYARLHTRARGGAAWFINQNVEPQLELLTAPTGSTGLPVFIAAPTGFPNIAEAPQRRLMGLPIYTVEYASSIGDVGDIILANLGWYALGTQGGIQEAMSIHLRFDFDETAFRFTFSVDGQTFLQSPLTPFKGTTTLSAYVTLAAR